MKRLSDNELLALLDDLESDAVERKQSFRGKTPTKAREAVCAFANDFPNHRQPGILFIGARDNGEPSHEPITDALLLSLADMKTDGNILPLPALTVEKRILKGAEMAIVTVHPSDMPPVRYAGRIWIRTGPRRSIANEQEERLLIERRRFRILPYDLHPVHTASVEDISRVVFEEEYLPQAVAKRISSADHRNYTEKLAACRMIVAPDDSTPTVAGLLTLGRKPQDYIPGARIQFLRINGTQWGDEVIDELRMDGSLSQQIQALDQKMMSHNRVAVDIVSAPTEIRRYDYPMPALQQLTRNAVMHRSYEGTHAPVMVYWFNDHIEIINAGGPYGRVTPENFGKPGFADYRNPNIAEGMKVLNLVQRFGVGIQMARHELAANGNPPPEFIIDPHSVICKVYPAAFAKPHATSQTTGGAAERGKAHDEAHDEAHDLSAVELAILKACLTAAQSTPELLAVLGYSSRTGNFKKALSRLLDDLAALERTLPNAIRSKNQKYRLTARGKAMLEKYNEQ